MAIRYCLCFFTDDMVVLAALIHDRQVIHRGTADGREGMKTFDFRFKDMGLRCQTYGYCILGHRSLTAPSGGDSGSCSGVRGKQRRSVIRTLYQSVELTIELRGADAKDEEAAEVVEAFVQELSRTSPWGGAWDMSGWEETPRQTKCITFLFWPLSTSVASWRHSWQWLGKDGLSFSYSNSCPHDLDQD